MLNGRNLIVDTFSEVYQILKPWITQDFWDFESHDLVPNSVYVLGRKQFMDHRDKVASMIGDSRYVIFFDNAAEGSWTLVSQLKMLKLDDVARQKKILIIGGGDMDDDYAYVSWEHFLSAILDYEENRLAMSRSMEIYEKKNKPYKFLFLNGRARPHRKYLYERFKQDGILDQSLWTMLDSRPCLNRYFKLENEGINLMATTSDLRWLDTRYEFSFYNDSRINPGPPNRTFIKHELFKNEWGEIYLNPQAYIDTYFSLVTETVFEYPYSFRTEKIAKPLAMAHPWIVASSVGWYRDIRNLGFQTFGHVIDESFDLIDNHQDRMDRIIAIVKDLCKQDLAEFQSACLDVCKYNQLHLQELIPQLFSKFPDKFFNLLAKYG